MNPEDNVQCTKVDHLELCKRDMLLTEFQEQIMHFQELLRDLNEKFASNDSKTVLRFEYISSVLDCIDNNIQNFSSKHFTDLPESRTSDCESGTRVSTTGQH